MVKINTGILDESIEISSDRTAKKLGGFQDLVFLVWKTNKFARSKNSRPQNPWCRDSKMLFPFNLHVCFRFWSWLAGPLKRSVPILQLAARQLVLSLIWPGVRSQAAAKRIRMNLSRVHPGLFVSPVLWACLLSYASVWYQLSLAWKVSLNDGLVSDQGLGLFHVSKVVWCGVCTCKYMNVCVWYVLVMNVCVWWLWMCVCGMLVMNESNWTCSTRKKTKHTHIHTQFKCSSSASKNPNTPTFTHQQCTIYMFSHRRKEVGFQVYMVVFVHGCRISCMCVVVVFKVVWLKKFKID